MLARAALLLYGGSLVLKDAAIHDWDGLKTPIIRGLFDKDCGPGLCPEDF
jgi:hypothetical protein